VVTKQYGARIARATYAPCAVCGAYVTLTEGTRFEISDDGNDEIHLTEECGHRVARPRMVLCPRSQADEWFQA
jgi:hypothetical protein